MELVRHIDPSADIPEDAQLGNNVVIESGVVIGAGAVVGNNVTIYAGTRIGRGCIIADNVVLGRKPRLSPQSTAKSGELGPLVVGNACTFGTGSCVYAGTTLGDTVTVADMVTIRERVTIGSRVVVGRGVCVENDVSIGTYTRIQTGAYITAYTTLEDHVFIAPMVTTTNDNFMGRTEKRLELMKGPTVKRGARIGGNAILLPGIVVGEEAFVAAGSVVTRDVPPRKLVIGVPARVVRDVPEEELLDFGKEGA